MPTAPTFADSTVYAELWTSLASLIRSYTAAHGLNRKEQATVELGEESIVVRAGERRLSLTRHLGDIVWVREDGARGLMRFTLEGKLETRVGEKERQDEVQEMDMQAEAWARELMR
jgi:hypothetical protein